MPVAVLIADDASLVAMIVDGCGEYDRTANPLYSPETGQRRDEFSDIQASANASAMEQFWYTTNPDFGGTDGEVEYSAAAGAAAHAMGRVTCQADGVDTQGDPVDVRPGTPIFVCAVAKARRIIPTWH